MGTYLETPRMLLRPFALDDARDLYIYASDPRVGPAAGWKPHESMAESRQIICTVFAQPHVFAVVEKADGRVIGSAGFVGRKHGDGGNCDEIGYSFHPDWWGRGLATEAVEALLRYGFVVRALQTIWCGHYEENYRSRRVVEKSGFTFQFKETVTDDIRSGRVTYLYKLERDEWERRAKHGQLYRTI